MAPDAQEKNLSDQALDCFRSGFSCSQAVFSTYAESLGVDRTTALKTAGAFGAGIAGRAEMCGAVSGALMAIGLKHGKSEPKDNTSRDHTYVLANEFLSRFNNLHGSILCRELVGYDLSQPDQYQAARQAGAFKETCPQLVRQAGLLLEEIW
jgi:C_GCAxxG_C_C family probable redox protein